MADFEKFIHDLAFQLNLSLMDDAQRARLTDYKEKHNATKDQNSWNPKAALPDPTSPEYDISTIDDWQKLYEGFQNVLYSLNSERKGATRYHDDVEKFLDKFYGVGKCIAPFEVSSAITSILTPAHATAFATYLNTIRAHLETNDIPSTSTDKLIKKLNTEKKLSILFISHDLALLAAICDRIAVLYSGELMEIVEPALLINNQEKHPYTHALKLCIPQIGSKNELTAIKGFIEKNNFLYNEKCIFADRCSNSIDMCFNKKPVFNNNCKCHNPL